MIQGGEQLGILKHSGPAHPQKATFEARLRTFRDWPPALKQKPKDLAEAGFIYIGTSDQVKCFFCDVKFITSKYRKDHCYEIHGKKDEFVEGNKIKCMVCKGIVKKVHLNKHRRKHFEESIPCKLCALKYPKSTKNKSILTTKL